MIEHTILGHLVYNDNYARKTLPFLKTEYFKRESERVAFNLIDEYVKKYNALPTREALLIDLDGQKLSQNAFGETNELIGNLKSEDTDIQWLLDRTEEFCQERAIKNAIVAAMEIMEDKGGSQGKGNIPKLLSDALAVSFDSHIGHDYLSQSDERFEFYHKVEERIPFGLEMLDKATNGGIANKTLNLIIAGTHVGKSLGLCSFAAKDLMAGKNVLYITLEMAEERIAERIDANLLDIPLDELVKLPKDSYDRKIARIRNNTVGNLVIKEYPTASAHAGHFRHLINELRLKKNFKPDVIYIDYLNICTSARIKGFGSNVNSYTLNKSIAEELRGLAGEFNVPIWSATQTNRAGFTDADFGMESTSESFGVPMTADFMIAMIVTEESKAMDQVIIKQLKNRYHDMNRFPKFAIGIDRSKMRLYDCEQDTTGTVVFDRTDTGKAVENEKMVAKWRKLIT